MNMTHELWDDMKNVGDPFSCVLAWGVASVMLALILSPFLMLGACYYSAVMEPAYDAKHHCRATGETEQRTMFCGKAPCTVTYYLYVCDGDERMWR